jgi:hypothetical protein
MNLRLAKTRGRAGPSTGSGQAEDGGPPGQANNAASAAPFFVLIADLSAEVGLKISD